MKWEASKVAGYSRDYDLRNVSGQLIAWVNPNSENLWAVYLLYDTTGHVYPTKEAAMLAAEILLGG